MGLRVMVVDDSVFMRNMLKKLISEAGGEIIGEAGDGKEAIERYSQLKPDLVFLDIVMPNMDGIQALRSIKSSDNNCKIVMCTSTGQEMVVKEAVDAGASDFIVKPFSKEDIVNIVQKYGTGGG